MRVGIIGAGNIGGTIARKLAVAGHSVKLAGSKRAEEIREIAESIGATPVDAVGATQDVDVIILSIPFAKIPDVASVFADVPANVVVVDTTNYYPQRDGEIAEIEAGKSESVWASEQLGRPVIKAFNAILAQTLVDRGLPNGSTDRIAIPVAGDNLQSKALVQEIIDETGFDSFDAGDLATSWQQQPGTPAYCTELSLAELEQALPKADKQRSPTLRDALMARFMTTESPLTHDAAIELNRTTTAPQ